MYSSEKYTGDVGGIDFNCVSLWTTPFPRICAKCVREHSRWEEEYSCYLNGSGDGHMPRDVSNIVYDGQNQIRPIRVRHEYVGYISDVNYRIKIAEDILSNAGWSRIGHDIGIKWIFKSESILIEPYFYEDDDVLCGFDGSVYGFSLMVYKKMVDAYERDTVGVELEFEDDKKK